MINQSNERGFFSRLFGKRDSSTETLPAIKEIKDLGSASRSYVWEDERKFPSPDGRLTAVFWGYDEVRMGVVRWSLKLLRSTTDITAEHPKLWEFSIGCSYPYQPWGCDGDTLLLETNWSESHVYKISQKVATKTELTGPPSSAIGSKRFPVYVVKTQSACCLLDLSGKVKTRLDLPWPGGKLSSLFWLDAHHVLAAVTQDSKPPHRAELRYFDSESGRRVGQVALSSVGLLADCNWDSARFDEGEGALLVRARAGNWLGLKLG